ncbi:MAG: hypothetical protein K9G71_01650 [Rhodobacteraceae bacterium]|jgi:hypothetical protein|nr:hypothetical protein [Paracoccaceae bacterium]MCF8513032.1 hypothetical protein [Paracoccaceae bacterium]MCF8517277.1 hypothetical protein [Paracoccaceae bacterium]
MIDRSFLVDHEEILRLARQERAQAIRDMMKSISDFVMRRKASTGAATV